MKEKEFKKYSNLSVDGITDKQAIFDVSKTMIEHWAEKMKYELFWTVIFGNVPQKTNQVVNYILDQYYLEPRPDSRVTFKEFKNVLINLTDKNLKQGFLWFLKFLKESVEKAWQQVYKDFRPKLFVFLADKKVSDHSYIDILSDCLMVFSDKLKKEKLKFENSREVKSYLFKTAEYKLKEQYRDAEKRKQELSSDKFEQFEDMEDTLMVQDEENNLVEYIINNLGATEKEIIYGLYFKKEKLKAIADRLKISEANCRVIKHRTMQALRAKYKTRIEMIYDK